MKCDDYPCMQVSHACRCLVAFMAGLASLEILPLLKCRVGRLILASGFCPRGGEEEQLDQARVCAHHQPVTAALTATPANLNNNNNNK